jgi:hypothetical protein
MDPVVGISERGERGVAGEVDKVLVRVAAEWRH